MVFVTLNIFANEQNRGKRRCCSGNFTLGPSVICIYIESIRFWFIIVTILGVGAGNRGRLAGILSPVMRPLSMNIPGRRKQPIIMVLELNWCCSLPSHILLNLKRKKSKQRRFCFPEIFKRSADDYRFRPARLNPHLPLAALSQGPTMSRPNQRRCTADGHMTNGFIAPLWRFES